MEYWQRWDNKRFDTEEEAWEDYYNNEDNQELVDYLLHTVENFDFERLLNWAIQQDGFFEIFQDEIAQARQEAFNASYCNWEEPDDEDDFDPYIVGGGKTQLDFY